MRTLNEIRGIFDADDAEVGMITDRCIVSTSTFLFNSTLAISAAVQFSEPCSLGTVNCLCYG